ncbi:MAG: phytanoyl-CoA dioxygenase family protein [Chitinophagales bacterium]
MDNIKIQLSKDGFVVIDLLDEREVNYLNDLSKKYLVSTTTDFISSSHFLSVEDSRYINQELHKIITPRIQNLFPELDLLGGTLATKVKGKAVLKTHNDWSIVDEEKYNSYNLWVALVDTDNRNGTLGLIPGSHLWKTDLRGLNIPGVYEKYTPEFLKIGWEPSLKAGQAILYNHKLIHYSRPNLTDLPRNVAIVGMKDKEAGLRVSFTLDHQSINTYEATEEDFYRFDAQKILKNRLIHSIILTKSAIDWHVIAQQYDNYCPAEYKKKIPQPSIWSLCSSYFYNIMKK